MRVSLRPTSHSTRSPISCPSVSLMLLKSSKSMNSLHRADLAMYDAKRSGAKIWGTEPDRLIVELTESSVIQAAAPDVLARLHNIGGKVSIDDFGSTPRGSPARSADAIAWFMRSANRVRFGSPVRASCSAW